MITIKLVTAASCPPLFWKQYVLPFTTIHRAGLFHVPPSFVSYCIRTELFAHDIRRIGRKCMGKSDSSKKWRAIGEVPKGES